jgi:hypothetical protein
MDGDAVAAGRGSGHSSGCVRTVDQGAPDGERMKVPVIYSLVQRSGQRSVPLEAYTERCVMMGLG